MKRAGLALLAATSLAFSVFVRDGAASPSVLPHTGHGIGPNLDGWRDTGLGGIRGITVGPIESGLHPGKGYGSPPSARTMDEVRRLGGNWVSLTPFGRMQGMSPRGIDRTFEAPFARNKASVAAAVRQAHAAGLRVLLVPHLWLEIAGETIKDFAWRGEIDPGDDAEWATWSRAYRAFLLEWAKVAESTGADMLSVGVELRSWVTTTRATSFAKIIHDVRGVYHGPLTYAANWDDVEETTIIGELDVIGVNAFFRLSEKPNGTEAEWREGARAVVARMRAVAEAWHKPILFTEVGYTTRSDVAYEPWLWPDGMTEVKVDQEAQARAYTALLEPIFDEPWFAGMFVWRYYADPDDMSQESEWGFSPRGKSAELAVRDAFATRWFADGKRSVGAALVIPAATRIGLF